ncbi:RNA ligase [Streptomyces synnematoformans]|uniref:T4 RNA ligase 1-like N-terminal domain-containing protein n=1 Tax=Streptomyces synnematoformans TaxID=415721 RepID=A0ABN2X9G5_9ACTN
MPVLDDLFDPADLAAAIDAGHVTRKQHPKLPISILTYTPAVQYERAWTPVTRRCRGLVVDDGTGEIIGWPFEKFFNLDEAGQPYAPPLPDEPFQIFDKIDGSLSVVFFYDGQWRAASKGSFASEQAVWSKAWLDDHDAGGLRPGVTYLAETLYPENRIVVDYGGREDLVLLGAYDRDGAELPLHEAAVGWRGVGSVVRTWPAMPLQKLRAAMAVGELPDGHAVSGMEAEGFVLRYASGLRVKCKLAEYVRLHKILTGVNERDIWRLLGIKRLAGYPPKQVAKALMCPPSDVTAAAGTSSLDGLLAQVPDEFYSWVRSVCARLDGQTAALCRTVETTYAAHAHLTADRRAFAEAVQSTVPDPAVRSAVFLRLDGRPYELPLWRSIRPEPTAPFRTDEEN